VSAKSIDEAADDLLACLRTELSGTASEANPTAPLPKESPDWRRARRERRAAERDLPDGRRQQLRRIERSDLAEQLASSMGTRLLEVGLARDGRRVATTVSALMEDGALEEPLDGGANVEMCGARDRRRYYTMTFTGGADRANDVLTPLGRRRLHRELGGQVSWTRRVANEVDNILASEHMRATASLDEGGSDERVPPTYRPLRDRVLEVTSWRRTRLDDPPGGWIRWALERETRGAGGGKPLLLGMHEGIVSRVQASFGVAADWEPNEGRTYDTILASLLPAATPDATRHHGIYGGPDEAPGMKRWSSTVEAVVRAVGELLAPGGEAIVLVPLDVRANDRYTVVASLHARFEEVLGHAIENVCLRGDRLSVVDRRHVFEPENRRQAWPFVGTERPALISVVLRRGSVPTAGALSLGVRSPGADSDPSGPRVEPRRSPPTNPVSASDMVVDEDLVEAACSLRSLSQASAWTQDALGRRIVDDVRCIGDLERQRVRARDLLAAPDALVAAIRQEPLRTATIAKPEGGHREVVIPTLLHRMVGHVLREVIERRTRRALPRLVRSYRPARDAQVHAVLDAAEAVVSRGARYYVRVDFEAFFDSIPHTLVGEALRNYGFDEAFIRIVLSYLAACTVQDRRGRMRRLCGRGVPQGLPFAPVLANLVCYELDRLLAGNRRVYALRWSDDVLVLGRRRSELVGVARQLRTWARKHGIGLKGIDPRQSADSLVSDVQRQPIQFLGHRIMADGRTPRDARRFRQALRDLERLACPLRRGVIEATSKFLPGGGTDAVDQQDVDRAADGIVDYLHRLDPAGERRARRAIKDVIASTPVIMTGRATEWRVVLPTTRSEHRPETMIASAPFQQPPTSQDQARCRSGVGSPAATDTLDPTQGMVRGVGGSLCSVSPSKGNQPEGISGPTHHGMEPQGGESLGGSGPDSELESCASTDAVSSRASNIEATPRPDGDGGAPGPAPGARRDTRGVSPVRRVFEKRVAVEARARRGPAGVVTTTIVSTSAGRRVNTVGGRPEVALVRAITIEVERAAHKSIERLFVDLTEPWLPKLLAQRRSTIRSPLLFAAVLRLHEIASSSGVEVVLVAPSA